MLAESLNTVAKKGSASHRDEAAWRALDQALRRLVGRLCVAARGQSKQLDAQLMRVIETIRKRSDAAEVEHLLDDLGRAIAALDDKQQAAVETAADSGPSGIAQAVLLIARLVERLALEPRLLARAGELTLKLASATTEAALADSIERIAELVNEQLQQFQRDKGEVERTLHEVNEQLDQVASYLFGEDADRVESRQSGQRLDGAVVGELKSLGDCVAGATDLVTLRHAVTQRTGAIHSHLSAFREREAARVVAYHERADRMRSRIGELERQTRALQNSLQREKRLSLTDALTGIPNRLAWDERIAHEFARWRRFGRPMCLATWDIDRFKAINDNFGHAAGDKVLHVVAQYLAKNIREVDFVSRYGGEEFAMLLVGTVPEDAMRVCEQMRERIAKLNFHFRKQPIPVTISCGIASFAGDDSAETVFERADVAMYRAKREGRNMCVMG